MGGLLSWLQHLPVVPAYAVIAALVFAEAAIFVGFVLPGETACLLGGFLAATGRLQLAILLPIVVGAAIVGDSVGYEVGRTLGSRLAVTGPMLRHAGRVQSAQDFLRRRGGPALVIGRFTAFLRAVMPGLAGMSRMPYRRFLPYNAAGGLIWGIGVTLLGYFAGASYARLEKYLGGFSAAVLVLLVATAAFFYLRHRRRAGRNGQIGADPG